MSLSAMAASGVRRQEELTTAGAAAAAGPPRAKDPAMEKVTKFIPTEVIGIYVAALGIFAPVSAQVKWSIYGICLVLVPVLIYLGSLQQKEKQKAKAKPNWQIIGILSLFGVVAFTAWVWALPETPFLAVTPLAVKIGAVAVLVLAAVMHPLADALGVLPKR